MLVAEHYGTLLLHAIHEDAEWAREADVAHIVGFFYGWHSVEDILAEDTIVGVAVYSEIAYTKRGEVLEEVSALTWVHTIVLQCHLRYNPCCRDVMPFHWYAKP